MKRSFFLVSAVVSGVAISLRMDRPAIVNESVRKARRRVASLEAFPGRCSSHRGGARWSGYTLRDMLG